MNSALLYTEQLDIGYRLKRKHKTVLSHINLSLEAGQVVALLGPNGVGKSTLLRTISGIQPQLAGEVYLKNQLLKTLNKLQLARHISVVLTERNFSGNLTVLDLISLGRYPYTGWSGNLQKEDHRQIEEAIEKTQTGYLLSQKLHEISDGQLQKAMIARALAQDGDIMILDEPTAHLDLSNKIEILLLLSQLSRDMKKGIIIATHELNLSMKIADQIWLAQCDAPIIDGLPEELMMNGTMKKIYGGKDYKIDQYTGEINISMPSEKEIILTGEEQGLYWTRNALQRIGFKTTNTAASLQLEVVKRKDIFEWRLSDFENVTSFFSLRELINHLRKT
jgi:iron complex transport system ATP-binding protein